MNRFLLIFISFIFPFTPALAAYTPIYAGVQLDNISGSALLGYQINKTYAVEANYNKSDSHIVQAGMVTDAISTSTGLAAIVMFPMSLTGGSPYFLFAKAGYERVTKEETYYIPASVTLSVASSGNISTTENRAIYGGGVQYDFYQALSGRAGFDVVGDKRSVYIGAIIKF
jgi:hypothetical protein